MGLPLGIDLIPSHRIDRPVELPGFAHATRVLPLSLRGQVPAPTGGDETCFVMEFGQSPSELPSLLPADLFHRQICAPKLAGIVRHEQGPLGLSARCLGKEKAVRQSDAVQHLIRLAVWLVDRAAHQKSPRRDPSRGPGCSRAPRRQREPFLRTRGPPISADHLAQTVEELVFGLFIGMVHTPMRLRGLAAIMHRLFRQHSRLARV